MIRSVVVLLDPALSFRTLLARNAVFVQYGPHGLLLWEQWLARITSLVKYDGMVRPSVKV